MERYGATFIRCVDMFALPAAVIYAGTGQQFDPTLEVDEAEIPVLQHYWRVLLYLHPSLETDLRGLDPQGLMTASTTWFRERGRVSAEDGKRITLALVEWLADDLEEANVCLHPGTRANRGFNNVVTGRHLCPISLDYDDQTVREALSHGTFFPAPGDYPRFLFDMVEYDPGAPWNSILRGPLIVLAWYHIFDHPRRRERAFNMSLPFTSVAKSHGMTQVTIGSIIYATTMVHSALSAPHSLRQKGSAIRTLHDVLVKFVNDPAHLDIVESLLRWWNRIAFPIYTFQIIPRFRTAYPDVLAGGFTAG